MQTSNLAIGAWLCVLCCSAATAQDGASSPPVDRNVAQGKLISVSAAPTGEMPKELPRTLPALAKQGQVEYVVMRGDGGFVVGRARHQWQVEGKQFVFKSAVETTGIAALFKSIKATQESRGEITASGYRPTEFVQERGKGSERAQFDWKQGRIKNGEEVDPLVAGTQDVLSVYYQLAWLAPTKGVVDFPIATGRKLDQYRFEVIGAETLATDDGPQATTHVRVKTGSDTMDLWLAPTVSPLPLRITILNKKGELFDQRVKRSAP